MRLVKEVRGKGRGHDGGMFDRSEGKANLQ